MIHTALIAARDMLRRHMGPRAGGEELVHITCPGRGVEGQRNYLGIMFIGLEQEARLQSESQGLNLDANAVFMLYSVFSDYGDSLRQLSAALECFQENTCLNAADFPQLDFPGRCLYVEPYFFPLERQLQTWNPFMDDSIPFMFYKLRSLRFKTSRTAAPGVREVAAAYRGERP